MCVCEEKGRAGYDFTKPTAASPPTSCSLRMPSCKVASNLPPQDASKTQLVHLPRHILVELVNDCGSGPWHKEIVFFLG